MCGTKHEAQLMGDGGYGEEVLGDPTSRDPGPVPNEERKYESTGKYAAAQFYGGPHFEAFPPGAASKDVRRDHMASAKGTKRPE